MAVQHQRSTHIALVRQVANIASYRCAGRWRWWRGGGSSGTQCERFTTSGIHFAWVLPPRPVPSLVTSSTSTAASVSSFSTSARRRETQRYQKLQQQQQPLTKTTTTRRQFFSTSPLAKMKDNAAKLFPNPDTAAKVMDYSVAHSTPLPDWLMRYHEWGCSHTDVPNYLTSSYQAQTLVFLARMMGAKRVLEIGVYIGFSAMFWSHAVGEDGSVVGLEVSERYATQFARKAFAEHNINNITLHVGDAVASLKALPVPDGEPFDIVFIDANKEAYPAYLDILLSRSQPGQSEGRLLRPGGLIVADNVLRSAIVADDSERNPNVAEILKRQGTTSAEKLVGPLREFNKKLVEEPRLETVLLPLFDGLGLARLKD